MKISKTTWIILIVGVFLILGSSIGWIYYQQLNQQNAIDADIAAAKETLAGINFDDLNRQKAEISKDMSAAEDDLEDIQKDLYTALDSIQITDILLSEAQYYDISIKEMSSSGEASASVAAIHYNTLDFVLNVEGTMKNIKLYVERINELFPTSASSYVQMDRIEEEETESETEEEEETEGETITVEPEEITLMKGKISLVIYSYEGE